MEEFLIKAPESTIGVTPLGDSNPEILESQVMDNFNNYSYTITITLKGSNALRLMADKLDKQYNFFKKLIKEHIADHCHSYIFYFEKHKCGSWIHAHGIIHQKLMKSVVSIKRSVYEAIELQPIKKGMTYKRRIDMEKTYDMITWWTYCKKDEPLMMKSSNGEICKLYKLSNKNSNSLTVTF